MVGVASLISNPTSLQTIENVPKRDPTPQPRRAADRAARPSSMVSDDREMEMHLSQFRIMESQFDPTVASASGGGIMVGSAHIEDTPETFKTVQTVKSESRFKVKQPIQY